MKIVIEADKISISFESEKEKEEFFDSEEFKELMAWKPKTEKLVKKIKDIEKVDWKKFVDEHPDLFNPYISPIVKDPPLDVTPRIDDPPHFIETTGPNYEPLTFTTYTDKTVIPGGGAYIEGNPSGCDATPRYGKATVDWPSKYPCDATPESFKRYARKSRRSKK